MVQDPSKILVCSPQILLTPNWVATIKQIYGDRSVLYCHESQQNCVDPRNDPLYPFLKVQFPRFECVEETEPELLKHVEDILANSNEQWVVILGRQKERLRALHRLLMEKN
jgi:hypothetical protein